MKTRMVCQECGKHFNKVIKVWTVEIKCPCCGSYDVEVE